MAKPFFSSNEMNLQNRYLHCAWSGGLLAAAAPAALQALALSILARFFLAECDPETYWLKW